VTYVIAEPCMDVKDTACVQECPVDCIYEGDRMLYIHPTECIDCGACEPACPVEAIFYADDVPDGVEGEFTAINAEYFEGSVTGLGSPGWRRRGRRDQGRPPEGRGLRDRVREPTAPVGWSGSRWSIHPSMARLGRGPRHLAATPWHRAGRRPGPALPVVGDAGHACPSPRKSLRAGGRQLACQHDRAGDQRRPQQQVPQLGVAAHPLGGRWRLVPASPSRARRPCGRRPRQHRRPRHPPRSILRSSAFMPVLHLGVGAPRRPPSSTDASRAARSVWRGSGAVYTIRRQRRLPSSTDRAGPGTTTTPCRSATSASSSALPAGQGEPQRQAARGDVKVQSGRWVSSSSHRGRGAGAARPAVRRAPRRRGSSSRTASSWLTQRGPEVGDGLGRQHPRPPVVGGADPADPQPGPEQLGGRADGVDGAPRGERGDRRREGLTSSRPRRPWRGPRARPCRARRRAPRSGRDAGPRAGPPRSGCGSGGRGRAASGRCADEVLEHVGAAPCSSTGRGTGPGAEAAEDVERAGERRALDEDRMSPGAASGGRRARWPGGRRW
jgi:ferredoxin